MKKTLSLFLALVMALSLCVTAFAGNATGSTAIRLTGDAADQVVDLKSGQHLSADSSTLVRLNVLDDPGAEEYTVTLDGEKLTPDHSTSQYHFYAVPAAKRPSVATLNVSTRAAEGVPVTVTVKVGNAEKKVALPTDGSTDPSATPTAVTVEFENPGSDAAMDRIYFDMPEGVTLGDRFSNGAISGKLTKLDAGYTGDQLFFYKDPKTQTKSVKAIWNDGTVDHYYTITVKRAAQEGLALGQTSSVYDANPCGAGATNGYNKDGFLKTSIGYGPYVYTAQAVYLNGVVQRTGGPELCAQPDWDSLKKETSGMCFNDGNNNVCFARVGRYWLPITYTGDAGTVSGFVPIQARLGTTANVDYYIGKAQAVGMTSVPAEAQDLLTTAINTVESNKSQFNNCGLTQNENGEYEAVSYMGYSGIYYRDYFGYKPYAEALYEKEINMIMDLTAIFTTWGTNAELAAQQFEAYQKILNMDGGIQRAIDIQSLADRDKYQDIRQAKWDLLKTTDLAGINAILTSLKLEEITPAEPQVTVGDIDGNGKITLKDATLLLQHVNKVATLENSQLAAADINGDGKIALKDATLLLQYVNKIIDALPSGSAE